MALAGRSPVLAGHCPETARPKVQALQLQIQCTPPFHLFGDCLSPAVGLPSLTADRCFMMSCFKSNHFFQTSTHAVLSWYYNNSFLTVQLLMHFHWVCFIWSHMVWCFHCAQTTGDCCPHIGLICHLEKHCQECRSNLRWKAVYQHFMCSAHVSGIGHVCGQIQQIRELISLSWLTFY